MSRPRPCRPTTHTWHLACALPLTIADLQGWYGVLIVRRCGHCRRAETWIGEQNTAHQQIRLLAIDQER